MSTTTIADVRDKLADVISTITGLRASGYVSDRLITPPCVRVARSEMDPQFIYGETKAEYPFQVAVYASRGPDLASEKLLDTYCELSGGTSIPAAVQTLTNWAGVAIHYAFVSRVSTTQVVEIQGVDYLLVELDVTVCF